MTIRPIVLVASVLLCAAVAGCASDAGWQESVMIVPGYYDTMECPDLTAMVAAHSARIKELTGLIEKSGSGIAGSVVSVMAYRTDLAKAHASHDAAERASKRKGCDQTAKPAAPAAPPPAPASGRPPRR